MNLNVFLISPSLKHQDIFREALNLIERSNSDVSFQEITSFSYQVSSRKFKDFFPPSLFRKKNKSIQEITKDPDAKYYDLLVIMGGIEEHTMFYAMQLLSERLVRNLLVIEPELPPDVFYQNCMEYAEPINPETGNKDPVVCRLAKYAASLYDVKGISRDVAAMYRIDLSNQSKATA